LPVIKKLFMGMDYDKLIEESNQFARTHKVVAEQTHFFLGITHGNFQSGNSFPDASHTLAIVVFYEENNNGTLKDTSFGNSQIPATEHQKAYLTAMNVQFRPSISKSEASALIDANAKRKG